MHVFDGEKKTEFPFFEFPIFRYCEMVSLHQKDALAWKYSLVKLYPNTLKLKLDFQNYISVSAVLASACSIQNLVTGGSWLIRTSNTK